MLGESPPSRAKALGGLVLIRIKDVLMVLRHHIYIMTQAGETNLESPGETAQMELEEPG
jgi:hypothetical protein